MATPPTPIYGLPYLSLGDAPDIPALGENLALAVEAEMARIDAEMAAWRPVSAAKPGATGRASTVSIFADPHLSISLPASSTWDVFAGLFLSSQVNASGDWRGALAWSGTATVSYGIHGLTTGIAAGGSADLIASPTCRLDTTSPGTELLAGCSTSGMWTLLGGRITCTTAVTLALHWAQRVSSASETRVLEGSTLTAHRAA